MKVLFYFLGLVGLLGLTLSCGTQKVKNLTVGEVWTAEPNWTGSFQGLAEGLSALLPITTNSQEFENAERRPYLIKRIERLSEISSTAKHGLSPVRPDPRFTLIGNFLPQAFQNTLAMSNLDRIDLARHSLLQITATCIECHQRSSQGPNLASPDFDRYLIQQRPLDKAEYYLAVRKFDLAREALGQVISSADEAANFFEVDRAIRYLMGIAVQFQMSSDLAEKDLQQVGADTRLPFYLRHNMNAWTEAIREWKIEKPVPLNFEYVESLIEKGAKAQAGFADRGGDIYFFRSIHHLHQLIAGQSEAEAQAPLLFLLGTAYEAIRDLGVWRSHELYFEACVRKLPKSSWSQKCFERLQHNWQENWGLDVPPSIMQRMEELRLLSI